MTKISGDLRLVTNQPALVSQAWVRAVETRADGAGVIVDDLAPVLVQQGQIEFECAPGVAVLVLAYAGGVPAKTIPLVVAGETQSLGDAVRAGQGVDGATQSALDALREDIAEALSGVSTVAADAAAAAELAELAEADAVAAAGRAETAAGVAGDAASRAEAAAEVAGEAAQSAGEDASAADLAAGRAESAAESAGQAAGRAETAAGVAGDAASRAEIAAELAGEAAADASTKAIADKVSELLEGAPEAYDTLKEVADALEAHDDAASAMITQIAGKADVKHTHTTGEISDASDVGRQVLSATSAAEARAAIGAGTSSLVLGTTGTTAAAGDHTHATAEISGLDTALAGKAPVSHTHATSEITGLDTALAAIPKVQVVDTVPESPDEETLYLVKEA